jgi:hypothetical protein
MMLPGRRTALRWLLLGGLAAAGTRFLYLGLRRGGLLGNADATEAAARLGASYLGETPGDRDANGLSQRLLGVRFDQLDTLTPAEVRKRVQVVSRQDLLTGDVVQIGGWIVSRAEGRLCALVHLLGASPARGS